MKAPTECPKFGMPAFTGKGRFANLLSAEAGHGVTVRAALPAVAAW